MRIISQKISQLPVFPPRRPPCGWIQTDPQPLGDRKILQITLSHARCHPCFFHKEFTADSQIDSIQPPINRQRLRQFSRPGTQFPLPHPPRRIRASPIHHHLLNTLRRLQGADQHRHTLIFLTANHVQTMMRPVREIHVRMPARQVHRFHPLRPPSTKRMTGRIALSQIRLHLHNDPRQSPSINHPDQPLPKQSPRNSHRIIPHRKKPFVLVSLLPHETPLPTTFTTRPTRQRGTAIPNP